MGQQRLLILFSQHRPEFGEAFQFGVVTARFGAKVLRFLLRAGRGRIPARFASCRYIVA